MMPPPAACGCSDLIRTDGRMDGRTDGRTDGWTGPLSVLRDNSWAGGEHRFGAHRRGTGAAGWRKPTCERGGRRNWPAQQAGTNHRKHKEQCFASLCVWARPIKKAPSFQDRRRTNLRTTYKLPITSSANHAAARTRFALPTSIALAGACGEGTLVGWVGAWDPRGWDPRGTAWDRVGPCGTAACVGGAPWCRRTRRPRTGRPPPGPAAWRRPDGHRADLERT